MSQPSWFSPTNNLSVIANPNILHSSVLGMEIDIRRLRSLWLISFIQDMRNLMSISLLSSLLSISVIVQESLSQTRGQQFSSFFPNDMNALAVLDMSLSAAPTTWESSVHAIRSFLDQHFIRYYASGSQKVDYVMQMTNIISSLSLEAHRGIEQCLLNMFCRSREGGLRFRSDRNETPDSLLSSVHGL